MTLKEVSDKLKPLVVDYDTYKLREVEVQYLVELALDLQAQEEGYSDFSDKLLSKSLDSLEEFPFVNYNDNKKEELIWKSLKSTAMADVEVMGQISLLEHLELL